MYTIKSNLDHVPTNLLIDIVYIRPKKKSLSNMNSGCNMKFY